MSHTTPAIRVSGVRKTFAKRRRLGELLRHPFGRADLVHALRDVNLEVHPGEVFGLLGPNGAGKTTLLKILSCLVLPDEGEARINGHNTAGDEMVVKRSIGYVTSDERSFYWRLSGAQNLVFFACLYRVPRSDIQPRVEALLERMELTHKADEPFSSYSSGMKQRLSIARALLHDPPILFLDEPTRSLDPVTARHIREFVRDELAAREGKTILLATHNLHEAAELCTRMAILSAGRVQRVGRLDEFRTLFQAGRRYRLLTDRAVAVDGIARVITSTSERATAAEPAHVSTLLEIDDDLSPLLRHLASAEVRVLELTRESPSLEDLFQHLFAEGRADDARGGPS